MDRRYGGDDGLEVSTVLPVGTAADPSPEESDLASRLAVVEHKMRAATYKLGKRLRGETAKSTATPHEQSLHQ